MTDRALTEASMLASLRDIHLPAEAVGGMAADLAATIGLAGCAALILAGVLRALSLRRKTYRPETLASRRARILTLPEPERRIALLHLLRDHAPERLKSLRGALYRPEGGVDTDTLEAEVARLA